MASPPPSNVCPAGVSCSYAFSCPNLVTSCPLGHFCASYEDQVSPSTLDMADENYGAPHPITFSNPNHFIVIVFGIRIPHPFKITTFACEVIYKYLAVLGRQDMDYRDHIEPGRYIQSKCIKGFYCPNVTSIVICPRGYWCPEGTSTPLKCDFLSFCASEGAYFQINFINFILAALLTIVVAVLSYLQNRQQAARERVTRESITMNKSNASSEAGNGISMETAGEVGVAAVERDVENSTFDGSGIEFSFHGLTVTAPPPNSDLVILDRCSGFIEAGKLMGILGPSGCGKSTLVSALRSSIHTSLPGKVDVRVQPGNAVVPACDLPRQVGYVPQEDIVDRNMTTRELLEFNAAARVPDLSREEISSVVDGVLRDLHIAHIADTVIGGGDNAPANISGGQLKRVSIACELVALSRPAALLCDEPTSGLDSSVAEELVRNLAAVSKRGVTVVMILQQPRPEIFSDLDKVFLMQSGGRIVFSGPSAAAAPFLISQGYEQRPDCSDADFCIDVLNKIIDPNKAGENQDATSLLDAVSEKYILEADRKHKLNMENDNVEGETSVSGRLRLRSLKDYLFLVNLQVKRAWTIRMRGRASLMLYAFLSIMMSAALSSGFSILIQSSYLRTLTPAVSEPLKEYLPSAMSAETPDKNVSDLGFQQLLFFMSSALGCASSLAAVPVLSTPWSLVQREDNAGISVLTFGIGRIIADMINVVWISLMFLGVWMLFGHAGSWYDWMAVIVPTSFAASGIGYICSVVARPGYASTSSILITFVCSVFSGLTPTLRQVENLFVLNWLWYLSFATWTAEATYRTWTTYLTQMGSGDSDVILKSASLYGYDISSPVRSVTMMVALGLIWRAIAVLLLYLKVQKFPKWLFEEA